MHARERSLSNPAIITYRKPKDMINHAHLKTLLINLKIMIRVDRKTTTCNQKKAYNNVTLTYQAVLKFMFLHCIINFFQHDIVFCILQYST